MVGRIIAPVRATLRLASSIRPLSRMSTGHNLFWLNLAAKPKLNTAAGRGRAQLSAVGTTVWGRTSEQVRKLASDLRGQRESPGPTASVEMPCGGPPMLRTT